MTGSFHLIQLIVNIKSSGTIQLAVILRMKKQQQLLISVYNCEECITKPYSWVELYSISEI